MILDGREVPVVWAFCDQMQGQPSGDDSPPNPAG